jgi:hypothetical protein
MHVNVLHCLGALPQVACPLGHTGGVQSRAAQDTFKLRGGHMCVDRRRIEGLQIQLHVRRGNL